MTYKLAFREGAPDKWKAIAKHRLNEHEFLMPSIIEIGNSFK